MGDEHAGEPGSAPRGLGFSTRAIHDGEVPGVPDERPVSPPIWLTATYTYEGLEHYEDVINERRPGYVYGRYGNPTHTALHAVVASLDGADAAWSFASGMAAVHTLLTALARSGDHLVAQRTVYGGTYGLLASRFPHYGIETTFVDPEADAVAGAIRPNTRAVLVETLANPTFRVADVAGVAAVCAARGVPLVVDNSVASPYLLRPLEHAGVTFVLQSSTKFLNGHSDVIGGVVSGPRDPMDEVRHLSIEQGTTGSAFEAWLTLRGIETLALRVARQSATALALAGTLEGNPKVESIGYSGLPGHPDHDRAAALFGGRGFGGMLSVSLHGGYEACIRFVDALRIARTGSSFGGLVTQICHPGTTSHRQLSAEERREAGIGDGLLRVAVGGEDAEDLIDDVRHGLDKA
jgi:cystathionine beta-lyase/cystathionine gamma-synthase